MSDENALRLAINSVWKALNTSIEWNGFTFSYAQLLVMFIAVVLAIIFVKFFT